MSVTPSRGQSIIVETAESLRADAAKETRYQGSELVGWITSRVNIWEDVRNRGYQRLWGEYWRMWRGKWTEYDMNRLSERSKLVAPALSQAIEMTVSEIEEAIFSKDTWFEIASDQLTDDIKAKLQQQFGEDLDLVNAKDQIMEAVQNGAIFGTMIALVNVSMDADLTPTRDKVTYELKTVSKKRVFVTIESIRPDEFIPDPVGKTIAQMQGCARRIQRPLHTIQEKCEKGVYRKDALRDTFPTRRIKMSDIDLEDPQAINTTYESEQVDIIEYHGKVPGKYLLRATERTTPLDKMLVEDIDSSSGEGPLVEAIVTIANTGVLLRAMANPYFMCDRAIVAAQFEKVPGRFWGRGTAEKGYNPQKALDAELRARMDALGYISAPMLGVDSGRLPRGFKFEVKPGKVWTTQGNPSEILQPVTVGNYNTLTFQQTQEMERMVQMGTGAFDTATALKAQSQSGANGASSNSALMGAFVKRSKRAIAGICRNFVAPVLQKVIWRYMQFDPIRYPDSFDVSIITTMGIVAREVEAAQMTQMMGMMPQEFHQAQLALAKGIVDHTSLSNKNEIMGIINKILNPPPPTPEQQQMQQLQQEASMAQLQKIMLENQKIVAEIKDIQAKAAQIQHATVVDATKTAQDWARIQQSQAEIQNFAEQNQIAKQRMVPEMMKAQAALISAKRKPSSSQ
jgi:hypothetical protein